MPTLFLDDDFVCLQSCFCFLRLLLKYHDPQICQVLSNAMVTPELYATSWFFTLFANKCERIEVVCELWREMVVLKDNKYVFSISLALIITNRQRILQCDKSELPSLMSSLSIRNKDELQDILYLARLIKEQTPTSFFDTIEINTLFGENSS